MMASQAVRRDRAESPAFEFAVEVLQLLEELLPLALEEELVGGVAEDLEQVRTAMGVMAFMFT